MAIKLNSIRCPECGAVLPLGEDCMEIFCAYCGTKIIATNENEFVFRYIDEAGIKQAEANRMIGLGQVEAKFRQTETERQIGLSQVEAERTVELKKLELAERKLDEEKKEKSVKRWLTAILVLVMIISFVIGAMSGDSNSSAYYVGWICAVILGFIFLVRASGSNGENGKQDDTVKVPSGINDYEKKNFATVEAIFRSAGFTQVKCVPLNDLTLGWFKKPGMVESITIDGDPVYVGAKCSRNARVVITYHSK